MAATTGTFYGVAMTAGDIHTSAGHGSFGFTGDGAPATSAEVTGAVGVTQNGHGGLLIAGSGRGRRITG